MNSCLFKLTPNDFLFKLTTKKYCMFRLLITFSLAVYTWHFVYLTVLFFFSFFFLLFSFMVALTGWMVRGLLREVSDIAVWWKREEGGEVPPSVWQTEALADRRPQLSSLCEAGGLCGERRSVLFPLPSLFGWRWVAGRGRGGGRESDDPGGPPTLPADEE